MADKLYDKYYWKRKELQRLRSIYKKRAERAKARGLYNATYLSQISNGGLGYKTTEDGGKKELYTIERFEEGNLNVRKQLVESITRRVAKLREQLNNPMTSIRGIKNMIKKDLNVSKVDMTSKRVQNKLKDYQQNPEGSYKHARVAQIMDTIDARTDLTVEEKELLKRLIRAKLSKKEKIKYDDWILEWDVDIDEILNNARDVIDRLSKGIPEDVLASLVEEASHLETTDTPEKLPW